MGPLGSKPSGSSSGGGGSVFSRMASKTAAIGNQLMMGIPAAIAGGVNTGVSAGIANRIAPGGGAYSTAYLGERQRQFSQDSYRLSRQDEWDRHADNMWMRGRELSLAEKNSDREFTLGLLGHERAIAQLQIEQKRLESESMPMTGRIRRNIEDVSSADLLQLIKSGWNTLTWPAQLGYELMDELRNR